MIVSAGGTKTGAARFSRYAKWMQLDGWRVSELGDPIVLIHKQLCVVYLAYVFGLYGDEGC